MLTLYHGRTSVCSLKARLALAEKALNFDSRLLTLRGDQFEPQYLKLNPNAVVPTLVHDDSVIIESTVIMHYVDDAFPGAPLMPQDLLARAKVRMITKLMDEYIHTVCMTLTFATARRPRECGQSRTDPHRRHGGNGRRAATARGASAGRASGRA
jgi:glutathione S-transferase